MSEAELMEALLNTTELFNSQFEFWITVTFAYVIAIHFSADQLSHKLQKFLTVLYLASSFVFLFRIMGIANSGLTLTARIEEAGYIGMNALPYQSLMVAVLTISIMVIGTIAAFIYAKSQQARIKEENKSD